MGVAEGGHFTLLIIGGNGGLSLNITYLKNKLSGVSDGLTRRVGIRRSSGGAKGYEREVNEADYRINATI